MDDKMKRLKNLTAQSRANVDKMMRDLTGAKPHSTIDNPQSHFMNLEYDDFAIVIRYLQCAKEAKYQEDLMDDDEAENVRHRRAFYLSCAYDVLTECCIA